MNSTKELPNTSLEKRKYQINVVTNVNINQTKKDAKIMTIYILVNLQ